MKRGISIAPVMISMALVTLSICSSGSAQSLAETTEAIQKAGVATRILFITAHPDDESSGLLAYLSHGLHADVALLTVTRGQGGQNAIGPEQDGELGVVRTEELLAADKYYGVHQFFTRAVDTGFSKSPEETMKIWGDVPLEDMVRVIRTYRPEVVINGWGGVHSGHGQHQATGMIVPKAVEAAADPNQFKDQIAEGLAPWRVTLELRGARGNTENAVEIPVNEVSPLWGTSYTDMGVQGHSQHVSQGTPGFYGGGYFRRPTYLITEQGEEAGGKFDAKLLAEPIAWLSSIYPNISQQALSEAEAAIGQAERSALGLDRAAAASDLARAGEIIEKLREDAAKNGATAQAAWELEQVQERIDLALRADVALPVQANADRHEIVAGESFSATVDFLGAPAVPVQWTVSPSNLEAPQGWTVSPASGGERGGGGATRFTISVPTDAKPPSKPADAVLPFPPALVRLKLPVKVDGYSFSLEKPFESVVAKTTGPLTYPLRLVPAVTLTVEPREVMVPVKRASEPVTLLARVRYHGTKPAQVSIGVDVPTGWTSRPIAPLDFSGAGDQLIRFAVTPPAHTAPGAYPLHPFARIGDSTFRTSLEPIPTHPTRSWSEPDDATVHVLNLILPAGLHIGYVAAENDPLPEVLRQLGIRVDMLGEVPLAFDDLSHYDAIVVGIRAYELRPDLPRMNWRLLNYAKDGGTLVVQYQREPGWGKYLPFPGKLEASTRVTNPNSPVHFLAPQNPLLNSPNKITPADFEGWIQERGIYFWGSLGDQYQPVLGLTDPGEEETNGSLVYARDGKGIYIYTGLSFFRELPAGVPGAYRLFVNLLSQTPHRADAD